MQNRKHLYFFRVACALLAMWLLLFSLVGCTASSPSDLLTPGSGPAGSSVSFLPSSSPPAPEPEPQEITVSFSAVGDNLIHNGIYMQAAERTGGSGYDFSYVYENLSYFFAPFDVNWINQETLVNNELEPSTYPCFSTPGELGQAAYDAGWRVFALSNNHTYDKGAAGIAATRRFWASMPEDVVTPGLFTSREDDSGILLQEVNGLTIAYLSYAEQTNGIPTPTDTEAFVVYTSEVDVMERQVRRAAELADAVVVGVHWGVENSHTVIQAQRDLASQFTTWGANVILGTHPHVIQPIEWVTDTTTGHKALVAYSLGNFLSAQAQANQMIGLALTFELKLVVQPDGTRGDVTVETVKAYPTVTHYDAGYKNIRDYMYRDYTEELAAQHGVRARYGGFGLGYIQELLHENISDDFLVLD